MQNKWFFTFSFAPDWKKDIDLFVIEADKFGNYISNSSILRDWLPKAIVFGSQFFLRKSFLLGCIDYLKDPWELDEFEIRLILATQKISNQFIFPWGTLALEGMTLLCGNAACRLTYQEQKTLRILLRHRGEPVPREVLYYAIRDCPGKPHSRVIDMHISALRKKIDVLCHGKAGKGMIKAVRGKGYSIPG